MGTSASSKGPGGGVPMVPPWVPDPVSPPKSPQDGDGAAPGGDGPDEQTPAAQRQSVPQPEAQGEWSPIAPAGRFRGTRLNLAKFARSGDQGDLRRGLREYVRKGYGGGATTVRRFGGTASTADALYGALSSGGGGQAATPASPLDPALLSGRSAREVMDAIVEVVCPANGTQDAEASRAAIKDALAELLTLFPDADLLNLREDQRSAAIERFVAIDVYRRIALDIGKTIQEKAATATVGLERLKEVKDYIKQTVAAAFRKLRTAGERLTAGRVGQLVRAALKETIQVFEEYAQ